MTRPRLTRPRNLTAKATQRLAAFGWRRGQALPLFEALAHSQTALDDLAEGTHASLNHSLLPVRLREVLIMRTLARWDARVEWDVHVLLYASFAQLSAEELECLGGTSRFVPWSVAERLLIDAADALRDTTSLSDALWDAIRFTFSPPECAEILMIATQYVKVALLTRALCIPALAPATVSNDSREDTSHA